jgi:hypothetical protein
LTLINSRLQFLGHYNCMTGKTDELARLNQRIAEFERCVADVRAHPGSGSSFSRNDEQIRMLHMLVTTLEAMNVRRSRSSNYECITPGGNDNDEASTPAT